MHNISIRNAISQSQKSGALSVTVLLWLGLLSASGSYAISLNLILFTPVGSIDSFLYLSGFSVSSDMMA